MLDDGFSCRKLFIRNKEFLPLDVKFEVTELTKGGFFQKVLFGFFRSPNLQKKIFQKIIPELEI